MPDWYGTTGRDDIVGGSDATQFSTTVEGITLCSVEPFTDDEIEALGAYFRMLRKAKDRKLGIKALDCDHCPHAAHNGMCGKRVETNTYCACYGKPRRYGPCPPTVTEEAHDA